MPATAKPVAVGGCACTTALTSGRWRYTSRCISISDDGSRSPWSFLPSRSVTHIMSGVMNPLQTLFGRHQQPIGAEAHADVAVVAARCSRARTCGGRLRRCRREADSMRHRGLRRGYLSRHAVEQKNICCRPSTTATARSGTTKVPHTGSRTIWTPRVERSRPAPRGPAGQPFDDAVDQPPERARDEDREDERTATSQHHAPGFWRRARRCAGCADLQRVERALGGLAFRAVRAEIWITCCHAFVAPSRSCLPNALTMPMFSSVFACLGSILSECVELRERLVGLVRVVVRRRRDRC